jgi:hypothetical protein
VSQVEPAIAALNLAEIATSENESYTLRLEKMGVSNY